MGKKEEQNDEYCHLCHIYQKHIELIRSMLEQTKTCFLQI